MIESQIKCSRYSGWAVLAVAALVLAFNANSANSSCSRLRPIHTGELAPDFQVASITKHGRLGPLQSLSSHRGKIVILDFWATWCGPCRASMPVLEDLALSYQDHGVIVLSLNTEGPGMAAAARKMAERLAPSVTLLSSDGEVSSLYKVTTIPHILVLDREGRVHWVHRGFAGASRLRDGLTDVLSELL